MAPILNKYICRSRSQFKDAIWLCISDWSWIYHKFGLLVDHFILLLLYFYVVALSDIFFPITPVFVFIDIFDRLHSLSSIYLKRNFFGEFGFYRIYFERIHNKLWHFYEIILINLFPFQELIHTHNSFNTIIEHTFMGKR